jgi:hypothetical protein
MVYGCGSKMIAGDLLKSRVAAPEGKRFNLARRKNKTPTQTP